MTYRVQIITANGEPVIDARVWSYDEAVALRAAQGKRYRGIIASTKQEGGE